MNNEDFVTYDIAVRLKEVGFGWPCRTYWMKAYIDKDIMTLREDLRGSNHNEYAPDYYSAPTLAQAQKWLLGKGYYINVQLLSRNIWSYVIENEYGDEIHSVLQTWDCYESALSAGTEAALKLIEEGEG